MPTDTLAAALHIAHHGEAWWQCLPFIGLTLLLTVPALCVVVLGTGRSGCCRSSGRG